MTDPRHFSGRSMNFEGICKMHERYFKAECKKHEKKRYNEMMALSAGSIQLAIPPGASPSEVEKQLFAHHDNIERYRSHLKVRAHMHGVSNAVARYGELPEDFAEKFGIRIADIDNPRVRNMLVRVA